MVTGGGTRAAVPAGTPLPPSQAQAGVGAFLVCTCTHLCGRGEETEPSVLGPAPGALGSSGRPGASPRRWPRARQRRPQPCRVLFRVRGRAVCCSVSVVLRRWAAGPQPIHTVVGNHQFSWHVIPGFLFCLLLRQSSFTAFCLVPIRVFLTGSLCFCWLFHVANQRAH